MSIAHASDHGSMNLGSSRSVPPGKRSESILGLHLSQLEPGGVANMLMRQRRERGSGAAILATANIQHIALMRTNSELRTALEQADVVTCDGFPVYRYARHRGHGIECRTTGREIVASIMEDSDLLKNHRLFFLVDAELTADALRTWADSRSIGDQVQVEVSPPYFIRDDMYCHSLSARVSAFETSLFFLCTGAPQSEVYAYRYRSLLPDCWALCVGQSAKLVLGLTPRPPLLAEKLNLEWLWRIALEPRRMLKRYVPSALGFLAAVEEDRMAGSKAPC